MDARSEPGLNDPFEEAIDDALNSLPADLRAAMSDVEIVVEYEPPDGQPLLGLYRGVPLPRRSSTYSGVLPDKISIFGGPITRLAAGDADHQPVVTTSAIIAIDAKDALWAISVV